jgi:hypothetical protein
MKRFLLPAVSVLSIIAAAQTVRAADDPSGTWKWQLMFNNQTIDLSVKLKLEGDKLTGTLTSPMGDVAIQDGQYKDGDLSFKVVRKGQDGTERTSKYSGKVSGDTWKAKVELERNGQTSSREFEAKRS